MISRELAKKLKDVGFPNPEEPKNGNFSSWVIKNTYGSAYYIANDGSSYLVRVFPGMCYTREHIYIPTLSELIEACGDNFYQICKINNPHYTGEEKWYCMGTNPDMLQYFAMTAEEAIANLYLALHPINSSVINNE